MGPFDLPDPTPIFVLAGIGLFALLLGIPSGIYLLATHLTIGWH